MEKEFKVKSNLAVMLFLFCYTFYTASVAYMRLWQSFYWLLGAGVVFYIFFIGFRPYKYVVDKKTVIIKYRLRPSKELDLMQCETICDPIPRMTEIVMRSNAIEIYNQTNKRKKFYPRDRVGFVEAVVRANKRIHCTVKDYTDVHRQLERKLRKERRKEEKRAARAKMKKKESK